MSNRQKVFFRLVRDEDGYPPVDVESVWVQPSPGGFYVLDNIPFFAREATLGDKVEAREEGGAYWYVSTVEPSGNSLIRVVLYGDTDPAEVRRSLEDLGCSTELDRAHRLVAVHVPPEASLRDVQAYLASNAEKGRLDYEEPILRQGS